MNGEDLGIEGKSWFNCDDKSPSLALPVPKPSYSTSLMMTVVLWLTFSKIDLSKSFMMIWATNSGSCQLHISFITCVQRRAGMGNIILFSMLLMSALGV